ncbi:hypothetical protein SOVF_209580, partial [Spinacia oleracea]
FLHLQRLKINILRLLTIDNHGYNNKIIWDFDCISSTVQIIPLDCISPLFASPLGVYLNCS